MTALRNLAIDAHRLTGRRDITETTRPAGRAVARPFKILNLKRHCDLETTVPSEDGEHRAGRDLLRPQGSGIDERPHVKERPGSAWCTAARACRLPNAIDRPHGRCPRHFRHPPFPAHLAAAAGAVGRLEAVQLADVRQCRRWSRSG